ncbi:uncharacterized protein LOC129574563 [Sitodiplosis mosellana]|uniref:uncharacterized protein LOC129574563 n=1 Tax=Sitodiplosis mosellana TaxID=263140 RepID=UPI0024438DB8|nr:uncharacterized protein LOC129574563 [Sitodiplosis mosellana]
MYTVNQGPSKLVAKTRTGLSQNYDKIETIRKIKVNNAQQSSGKSGGGSGGSSSTGQLSNSDNGMDINCAKPVFQQYRRSNSNRSNSSYKNGTVRIACFKDEEPQPVPSPQYEELIRYIRDSWNVLSVPEQDDATETQTTTAPTKGSASPSSSSSLSSSSSTHRTSSASSSESIRRNGRKNGFNANKKVIYHNDPPSPALDDFGPFDLESWWGRRLFNNITKSL